MDKHSDSAETDASVPRVPFIVGDAGINFENLLYRTGGSVVSCAKCRPGLEGVRRQSYVKCYASDLAKGTSPPQ